VVEMSKIIGKVGNVSFDFSDCVKCHFHEEDDCGKEDFEHRDSFFDYDAENNCIVCCGFEPIKKRRKKC